VTDTSQNATGPQPQRPRTRRRTRTARKETTVNTYDPAAATIVEPVITGTYVQRAATLNECTVAAAGILASADAAGLPVASSVTVYGWSPEINLLISGETPAETWANLEAWAVRHGSQGITVQPSVGGEGRAYASAEFTASGIRVILAAIIKGDPGNPMDIDPDTESATMPDATLFDGTDATDTDTTAGNTP
jgi:hypothetical protein